MVGVPLQIGPVGLETNLLLAPIAGWCDLAWRMTVRECGGVGLACTDLLSPKGLLCGSEASLDLARTNAFDQPIGMQLYGSDPGLLAEGARWCADHGATIVDINMGCPVDKVCKKDGGSKLMTNLDLAQRIAEAVRGALPDSIPLTCKMRLGWSEADAERNVAGELALRLTRVGAAAITVHGRTTEQRFRGSCRRDGIRRVVESVGEATGAYTGGAEGGVPVIGNGDVRTPEDAVGMLRETGCAGVMIGRGAFGNPWVFGEAWRGQVAIRGGVRGSGPCPRFEGARASRPRRGLDGPAPERRDGPAPEREDGSAPRQDEVERVEVVRRYFDLMREYRDDRYAMHRVRQKISWLGKSINRGHCRALKDAIRTAETPAEVHAALDDWLAGAPRVRDVAVA